MRLGLVAAGSRAHFCRGDQCLVAGHSEREACSPTLQRGTSFKTHRFASAEFVESVSRY